MRMPRKVSQVLLGRVQLQLVFVILVLYLISLSFLFAQESQLEKSAASTPFWRSLSFGSQSLNPDISLIGDFLIRPGARDAGVNALSLREAELGIQAAVDPYSRADIFLAVEEEEGKFNVDIEEAFLTFLALPFKSQSKAGRFIMDFGRTHRTHAPERDFIDNPLAFEKLLGVENSMKSNGISFNVLAPLPVSSYHEFRLEAGETKVSFGEGSEAVKSNERFIYARQKNFFPLGEDLNLELSGGFGRWQTEGGIEKAKSTSTFEGRAHDLIRSIAAGDFTLKWKPNAYRSFMLEGNYLYTLSRPLTEENENGDKKIKHAVNEAQNRGGFVHLQIQPLKRWYLGSRIDYVLNGETEKEERQYAGILTFFPSEFSRIRFQWNRKDTDGEERSHRFFIQVTWALGPHRPHPF